MITSVGYGAEMNHQSIAAGISQVRDTHFLNNKLAPMKLALVPNSAIPSLSDEVSQNYPLLNFRQRYYLKLSHAALSEAFVESLPKGPIPLLFAGPENALSNSPSGFTDGILNALQMQTGLEIDIKNSKTFALGRPGLFQAINAAQELMNDTDISQVLVGAVESCRDHKLLALLDAKGRIASISNSVGYSPGESAVFLLLSKEHCLFEQTSQSLQLMAPGFSEEEGHMFSDAPYLGEGLSNAVAQASQQLSNNSIRKLYSCMNGEPYWSKELGVLMTRNKDKFATDVTIAHPSDCFGDIGAAFCGVILGTLAFQDKGNYLIYGSADGAARAAICATVS